MDLSDVVSDFSPARRKTDPNAAMRSQMQFSPDDVTNQAASDSSPQSQADLDAALKTGAPNTPGGRAAYNDLTAFKAGISAPAPQFDLSDVASDFLGDGKPAKAASPVTPPGSDNASAATPKGSQADLMLPEGSGVFEPLVTAGTSLLAKPIAGLMGLGSAAMNGLDAGADTTRAVENAMTYQPRSDDGKMVSSAIGTGVQKISDFLTQPVRGSLSGDNLNPLSVLSGVPGQLADSGHPVLATAARLVPDAASLLAAPEVRGALGSAGEAITGGERLASTADRVEPSFGPKATPDADAAPLRFEIHGVPANDAPSIATASPELQQEIAKQGGADAVNPAVLQRHLEADSLPVPMQLSAGQATGDVDMISKEQNNRSGAMAQRMNGQNSQIIQNMDAIKSQVAPDITTPDITSLGQNRVDAYKALNSKLQDDISAKYQALTDANGGQFPVDGPTLVSSAQAALKQSGKARFLPADVSEYLSDYADGSTPMTFTDFENMRTTLAAASRKAARAGDGNAEGAIATVRNAVESLPMADETAALKPLADDARAAARNRFTMIDNDPAFKAAVNDSAGMNEPSPLADKFVQKYIIGAPSANVGRMMSNLADPMTKQEVASALMDHLKSQSKIDLQTNTGNATQAGFNKTLNAPGFQQKIDMAFDPKSAQQVRTLGNVMRYTQEQPRGSYVNNSNTALALKTAAGAAELKANFMAGGLPVGTAIRKGAQYVGEKRATTNALKPGAGLNYRKVSDLLDQ